MIPRLTGNSCEYVRASAVAWSSLHSPQCQLIDYSVASAIGELAGRSANSSLVIDCRDIIRIDDHAFDTIVDPATGKKAANAIREADRSLLFWLPEELDREFERALGHAVATYSQNGNLLSLYGNREQVLDQKDAVNQLRQAQSLLAENIQGWVLDCFQPWDDWRRLPSTPLLANGYFDSRFILTEPEKFRWTCVALRDLIDSLIVGQAKSESSGDEQGEIFARNIGLLSVSLRASAFAAAVSVLLGENFVSTLSVVDHAGPRKRIFERAMLEELPDGSDFILVSDFIVGGSELRAAEILAEFRGGQMIGAVCLGSALRPEEYNASCEIRSLTILSECAKNFKCTFLG